MNIRNLKAQYGLTLKIMCIASLSVLYTGCAVMKKDQPMTTRIAPEQIQISEYIHLAKSGWPAANWWKQWNDPQLNHLIETALNQAPSVNIARMRIEQSQTGVSLAKSVLGVNVNAVASQTYLYKDQQNTTVTWPYPINPSQIEGKQSGPWYTLSSIGLEGKLNLDIWGEDRAKVRAAIGDVNAQVAQQASIELDLASSIAQMYYGIQTAYAQLDLIQQLEEINQLSIKAHARRAQQGFEDQVAGESAKSEYLTLQQQEVVTKNKINQLQEQLRALLGLGPQASLLVDKVNLPELQRNLPESLGSELLVRRPDLQVYRWYVKSSLGQVDAAKAAFYPKFDIRAFAGYGGLDVGHLLDSSYRQFGISPMLYLPIFDSGRLNANLKSKRIGSNILIEQYNQAVLNAVKDIGITANDLNSLDQQVDLQKKKIASEKIKFKSAEERYKRGLSSYFVAQESRKGIVQAELGALDLNTQRIMTDIQLTKALGGGYKSDGILK